MMFGLLIAALNPFVALIIGILILMYPRFLNYYVAAYLIFVGCFGITAILFSLFAAAPQ
jgi:hypothetical protein